MIMAALFALAACAAPAPIEGFRDPDRKIYSSAVFDFAQLAGTWAQAADFAANPGCLARGVRFAPAGSGVRIEGQLCLAGRPVALAGPLTPTGPGRFAVPGVADPLWVLWADADLRSLVIGTPSGRFGFILNRDGILPRDRLTAASDVLAWNGYDLDRLRLSR